MYNMTKGIIFVISAPSGTGKTTICDSIIKKFSGVNLSISTTSRFPRENEEDNKDYHFISKDEFENRISMKKFVEWTTVLGNYYGTEYDELDKYLKRKEDVVLNINIDGGKAIKQNYPDSVLIFILPPSLKELQERLKKRGTETSKQLNQRLNMAKHEFEMIAEYDYLLVNENIEKTVEIIDNIIKAEKYKAHRYDINKIITKFKQEEV